jgi:hypothetical protein
VGCLRMAGMEVEDEGGFGVDGRQLKIWETSSGPARTPLASGITSSSPNTRISLQHCNVLQRHRKPLGGYQP